MFEKDFEFPAGLRGSFCLAAIHDGGLLLGRSRFASRSLFYIRDDSGFVTACSRLEPLVRLLNCHAQLDDNRLTEILLNLPGSDRTPYQSIRRLRPGELVHFRGTSTFHSNLPPLRTDPLSLAPDDAADELLTLVRRAIDRAIGTSKAVAVAVGGVDSSGLLSALATNRGASNREIEALTLDFEDWNDDRKYVQDLCGSLGITPIKVRPFECGKHLLHALVVDASPLPRVQASWKIEMGRRMKERGVEVVLNGEGGDQLFDGDLRIFSELALRGDWRGALADVIKLRGIYWHDSSWSRVSNLLLKPMIKRLLPGPNAMRKVATLRITRRRKLPRWAGPTIARYIDYLPDDAVGRAISNSGYWSDIGQLLDQLLVATGCPISLPHLDDDLVEFMGRLPARLLFHGGRRRGLYTHAFRHLLPHSILFRETKAGFGNAIASVIDGAGGLGGLESHLQMKALSARGLVNPKAFRSAFNEAARARTNGAAWFQLWPVIAAEAFTRLEPLDQSLHRFSLDQGFPYDAAAR